MACRKSSSEKKKIITINSYFFLKKVLNKQPNFKPQRTRRINLTQIYQEDGNKDNSINKVVNRKTIDNINELTLWKENKLINL